MLVVRKCTAASANSEFELETDWIRRRRYLAVKGPCANPVHWERVAAIVSVGKW